VSGGRSTTPCQENHIDDEKSYMACGVRHHRRFQIAPLEKPAKEQVTQRIQPADAENNQRCQDSCPRHR
jgi:hypothetical protein